MNVGENLRLAWDSLVANRLRSILTMLGIIIGVGAVIAVMAIGRGARAAVLDQFSGFSSNSFQMVAAPMGGSNERVVEFTEEDFRYLKRQLPELENIIAPIEFSADSRTGTDTRRIRVQGVPPEFQAIIKADLAEGRFVSEEDELSQARVVVIGPTIVEQRFADKNPLGETLYIDGSPFRVIGVFAPDTGFLAQMMGSGTDRTYVIPSSTAQRLTGQTEFQAIMVEVAEGYDAATTADEVKALLQRRHPGAPYFAVTTKQITDSISVVTNLLTGVIGAIAGISLLVGGVGIMNIMLVSVTERTREIGIRKAIGAKRGDIMSQFLIEAVTVSVGGGIIGTIVAAIPTVIVGKALNMPILIGWDSVALAAGFSLLVGVLFGVYPASQAAAKDPIDALRYE